MPFAFSLALNLTGREIREQARKDLPRKFDRPTPYIRRSVFLFSSNKRNLEATVGFNDEAHKAISPAKVLAHNIAGGQRADKRLETLLKQKGILGRGQQVVASKYAKKDRYGNISRGVISKVLAKLQANNDPYQNSPVTGKKRRRRRSRGGEFFAIKHRRGKLKPGIYERIDFGFGSAVRPVFLFINKASYPERYDFDKISARLARRRFPRHLTTAVRRAQRTARR